MPGTNAVVFKKALVALLRAAPELDGIQIEYGAGDLGDVERDCMYGGRTTFRQTLLVFQAGARIPRKEDGTTAWYARSYQPGKTQAEAEQRAVDLGLILEHAIAADPRLQASSIPGLLITTLARGDLIGGSDDDAAWGLLTYQIDFQSQLT